MFYRVNIFVFSLVCCSALIAQSPQSDLWLNGSLLKSSKTKEVSQDLLILVNELSSPHQSHGTISFEHRLKKVDNQEGWIELEDESVWGVSYFSETSYKNWQPGDRLKIYREEGFFSSTTTLENQDRPGRATVYINIWPSENQQIKLSKNPKETLDKSSDETIIVSSGHIFSHKSLKKDFKWTSGDHLYIYNHRHASTFDIYNLTTDNYIEGWCLIGHDGAQNTGHFNDQILGLEDFLNQRVIAQEYATASVARSIINYVSGLNDPKMPIGAFLFAGPTGVGKTELAKVLCLELFKDTSHLVRIDMSLYSERHTVSRLIGSPPGYVNHEEGGELTNALRKHPKCVVLFDEIEKAHPEVQKILLPVLDEGYLKDHKGRHISCRDAVFIMTTNLASHKLIELAKYDLEPDEILEAVEPVFMKELSPELYNRLEPVMFKPLKPEAMGPIVDLMLKEVINNLQKVKKIALVIDQTVREYLSEKGYHPQLGARPLKRLIKNTVNIALARAVLEGKISSGSKVLLSYDQEDDSWHVTTL